MGEKKKKKKKKSYKCRIEAIKLCDQKDYSGILRNTITHFAEIFTINL